MESQIAVYREYRHAMSCWTGSVGRCWIDRAAGRQFVFRYELRDTVCDERSAMTTLLGGGSP